MYKPFIEFIELIKLIKKNIHLPSLNLTQPAHDVRATLE